ncbi:hypothetical protein U9M48_033869 [Paspalum notatum var. saurae]|uniref:Uncharacterized protein n=1 Tax=Paspalum notatum var. saurae TaxID=547442 RepID=A0AAQ3UB32_PASNO
MPKLERCSCNSIRNLNSSLRVLVIEECYELKVFPLFESCGKFRIEQNLSKFIIHDCPQLIVSNPLPPSSSTCKLSIARISTVPIMHGSSNGKLIIGTDSEDKHDESSNELMKLDENNFSFHNLRALTHLKIEHCKNLVFDSLEGFRHLISLKSLEIYECGEIFSSDVLPEHTHVEMAAGKFNAFTTLKRLSIESTRISGKCISVMLRHAPFLEELQLEDCVQISGLLIEGREKALLHVPSNLHSSLKKIRIEGCNELAFQGNKEGFSAFASLEELRIWGCPKLISSLVLKDENSGHANQRCRLSYSPREPAIVHFGTSLAKLQIYRRESLSCLKKLEIHDGGSDLESLEAGALVIRYCDRLTALEGVDSLKGLRYLEVYGCPRLPPFLDRLSGKVKELFPRLDRLRIDDYSYLTESFCMHLSSLQRLEFWWSKAEGSTDEQERALQLLTSLQDLCFSWGENLTYLPVGLRSLTSLKRLVINNCKNISSLREKGLPPSLEKLVIVNCSPELTEQCRGLTMTSMIKVKIDGCHVN